MPQQNPNTGMYGMPPNSMPPNSMMAPNNMMGMNNMQYQQQMGMMNMPQQVEDLLYTELMVNMGKICGYFILHPTND